MTTPAFSLRCKSLIPARPRAMVLLLALLTLIVSLPTPAAETGHRPRIGLALSGGGARGAAHIGVLKVLESLQIPVDCITGTSMGSIIGGTYAAGIPTTELEQAIVQTDWDDVFNDKPPRREQAVRRKQDSFKGYAEVDLGLKDGDVAIAKGLVSGVQIESFLRRLTRPVADVEDFSRLPIPFRAVATNIETGDPVVLEKGSLPQAMRASMAIPGLIAPVEIDNQLLVDGGLANNLPITLARQTCADVVIAVNIQSPLYKRDQLTSAVAITGQLINLLGKTSVDEQLATLGPRDILITPELGDITSSSFDRQVDAIKLGEQAARALTEQLRRYSVPVEEYQQLRKRQQLTNPGLGEVQAIRFEGLKLTNSAVLRDLMQSKENTPLSEDVLAADMRRIYGRGDFEGIDYRISRDNGIRTLLVTPQEKSWGPDYLSFGLGLASDFKGDSNFALLTKYQKTWINRLGAEWEIEVKLGRRNRIATEFYQPLEAEERFFIAPYGSIENQHRPLFIGDQKVANFSVKESALGIDLGVNLGTYGFFRAGPVLQRIRFEQDTGTFFIPVGSSTSKGVKANLFIDQLDRAWLPTQGYSLNVTALHAQQSGQEQASYTRLETRGLAAFNQGNHIFNIALQGGSDLHQGLPGQELFSLGGPLRLSGYQFGEFQGSRYGFGRLEYRNRAIKIPSILGYGVYVGGSLEMGEMQDLPGQKTTGRLHSASLYLAADTALGPAYLGVGVGDGGRNNIFLVLGVP